MLIAGKKFGPDNIISALSHLSLLPSGFSKRTAHKTDDSAYLSSQAYRLATQGVDVLRRNKNSKSLKQSFNLHAQAVEISPPGNNLIRAISLARYAQIAAFVEGQSLNLVLSYVEKAMKICKEIGANDFASRYAMELHTGLYHGLVSALKKPGVSEKRLEEFLDRLRNVRREAMRLFRNQFGEPVDYQAYRVELDEVGFSSTEKMGTDFLAQCVSPIFCNPQSGRTALPHIDSTVDISSLEDVLQKIGYSDQGDPILVRLVGGRFGHPDPTKSSYDRMSAHNISTVMTFLAGKNVHIISADVLRPDQPVSLVVDPKTFKLSEAVPGRKNPDIYLATAIGMMGEVGKLLRRAFDLDRSKKRAPVLVKPDIARQLRELSRDSILDIYRIAREENQEDISPLDAERVECLLSLREEYTRTVGTMLQDSGLGPRDVNKFREELHRRPICVGENAGIANKPLTDFITKGLMKQSPFEAKPRLNLEGFTKIPHYEQPLDAILHPLNL